VKASTARVVVHPEEVLPAAAMEAVIAKLMPHPDDLIKASDFINAQVIVEEAQVMFTENIK